MAAVFKVESDHMRITAPHLKVPVNLDCKTMDGGSFVQLRKAYTVIQRLLVAGIGEEGVPYKDIIYKQIVFEELKALKDAQCDAHFPKPETGARRYSDR